MAGGSFEASAEEKLSELMQRDLGVTIPPRELRMFLRANWRKVSAYAHAVHCTEGQRQVPSRNKQASSNDCACQAGD